MKLQKWDLDLVPLPLAVFYKVIIIIINLGYFFSVTTEYFIFIYGMVYFRGGGGNPKYPQTV